MWSRKGVILISAGIFLLMFASVLKNYQLIMCGAAVFSFVTVSAFTTRHLIITPLREYPKRAGRKKSDMSITRKLSAERVFEDGEIDVELIIVNKKGSGIIEIRDKIPKEVRIKKGSNHVMLNLIPNSEVSVKYTVECPLMGPYIIGPVSIRTEDISGMFYTEEEIGMHSDFLVMPKTEEIKEVKIRSSVPKLYTGAVSIKQPGPGYEFYSLREYTPTDPLKNINWKAFVKTGKLMVNEREREAISDITIILDSRMRTNVGFVSKNPLIYSARAAATLSSYFLKRRDSVSLVVYDDSIHIVTAGTGESQLLKILTALAGATAKGSLPLQAVVKVVLPHIPPRSAVILISNLENDVTLPNAVRDIRANDLYLTILTMSSIDIELRANTISKASYDISVMERENMISELGKYGAKILDWHPDAPLISTLMGMKTS